MDVILNHRYLIAAIIVAAVLLAAYRLILWVLGVVIIPDDSVGVVTKKFVLVGKNRRLPDGKIVALNGEAGFQADTLSPGLHMGLWPWQFSVDRQKFLTVTQGKVGCVEAWRRATASRSRAGASSRDMSIAIPFRMDKLSSTTAASAARKWR
jgi:hypothetical protein